MVSYNGPNNYLTNPHNPHPYSMTKTVGQQPQVILQHNHPINDNLAYNQNRVPLNSMIPAAPTGVVPGTMSAANPPPTQMQPPPPSTHQHGHQGPPIGIMHRPSAPHQPMQPSGPAPPPP